MAANMSRKEILGKVYKMIPPMLESFHKGEHEIHSARRLQDGTVLTVTNRPAWTSGSDWR